MRILESVMGYSVLTRGIDPWESCADATGEVSVVIPYFRHESALQQPSSLLPTQGTRLAC